MNEAWIDAVIGVLQNVHIIASLSLALRAEWI